MSLVSEGVTHALIDGDIIAYRCAASCEPTKMKTHLEPMNVAIQRADELMYRILEKLQVEDYTIFLSSGQNWRKLLDPTYKAHRIRPDPVWLGDVQAFLVNDWNAVLADEMEADDALGMSADVHTVIVSIDKDLHQIPGYHYNFVKDEFRYLDPFEAERVIYRLAMEGDKADNIKGIEGIGPVKAARIINEYQNIQELHEYVRSLFNDDERFNKTLRLLKVLRSEEEFAEIQKLVGRGVLEEDQV